MTGETGRASDADALDRRHEPASSASSWSRSAATMMALRCRCSCARMPRRRLSRVRARRRSRSRRPVSVCRRRRRVTGHGAARAGAERHGGLDDLRSKSVPQLSSIQLIFKPGTDLLHARQLVAGAARDRDAEPADLGGAAGDDAAGVGDQPGHADRDVVEGSVSLIDDVHDGVLDDPGPAAAGPGVANVAIWGERLQMMQVQVDRRRWRRTTSRWTRSWRRPQTRWTPACCRFSNGSIIGTGGFDRDAEPADRRSGTCCRSSRRPTSPRCRRRAQAAARSRLGDVAERQATTSRSSATRSSTTAPACCWSSRSCRGATPSSHPGRGRGDRVAAARACPESSSTRTIFRPATFIETSIHNLSAALLLGFLLVVVVLALFLFEWRVALISLLDDPAVADGGDAGALLARRHRSTR